MRRLKICAVITENNYQMAASVEKLVNFYEVRLDLIGDGWQEWVGKLNRPWIACNRVQEEGGKWLGSETDRIAYLMEAVRRGAHIIDIELNTPGLEDIMKQVKKNKVKCLLSVHNLYETPILKVLKRIVRQEVAVGADICKVVTTARCFEDNMTVLRLFPEFTGVKLVALAMGQVGVSSRILSPMLGGYFTYASMEEGKESASGQLTVTYLRSLYKALRRSNV